MTLLLLVLCAAVVTSIVLIVRNHRLEADLRLVGETWRELHGALDAARDRAPMGAVTLPAGAESERSAIQINPSLLPGKRRVVCFEGAECYFADTLPHLGALPDEPSP